MFLVETIPVVSISKVTVKHSNYFTPLVTNAWDFLTFIFFFFGKCFILSKILNTLLGNKS